VTAPPPASDVAGQTAPGCGTRMRPAYRLLRYLSHLVFVGLFRGRAFGVANVPRTGGVLIVCNHQSFLDPVLATHPLPRECNYMARDTLFQVPWLGPLIAFLNAFPVKRDTADLGAIKETLRRLKAGKVVLTFPEGTRTLDGRVGEMRAGVVLLARKARVPIVPTVILGAYRAWPRTAKLPRPHPVVVAFGPPLCPHEHPEWDDDTCVAAVRDAVLKLQADYVKKGIRD
jgi:1-acyl-sn-glycerol-3-phosphate acyltransferase